MGEAKGHGEGLNQRKEGEKKSQKAAGKEAEGSRVRRERYGNEMK